MARRKQGKITDLTGLFIYQDPKHGTLFYDIFTRNGYNLTSSDLQTYLIYSAILPLTILAVLGLMSFFSLLLVHAIGIGASIIVLSEIIFRVLYLYKLPCVENYKPEKHESIINGLAKKYSVQRLTVLPILLVGIAICTAIYPSVDNLQGYSVWACYILSLGCVVFAILSLIALSIRKKNNY